MIKVAEVVTPVISIQRGYSSMPIGDGSFQSICFFMLKSL